ncbi:hypothetical protein MNBD_GAMMA01-896 [hydrothermal vent metagenome]|uniref:Uncharacterized protein n=1 Tax=hydrothermal vent metagenome TaxID=652676 RepID=A0A3B0VIG8_9ZZZZ
MVTLQQRTKKKEYSTAGKLDFAKIPPYFRQIASYSPQIMRNFAQNQTFPRYEYFLGQAPTIPEMRQD